MNNNLMDKSATKLSLSPLKDESKFILTLKHSESTVEDPNKKGAHGGVSTFLTGVTHTQPPSTKVGTITGKPLEELFPNADEITSSLTKLDTMIDVTPLIILNFLGHEQQDLWRDFELREGLLSCLQEQDARDHEGDA